MSETKHILSTLAGYHYFLELWHESLSSDNVEYFAQESLLMSLIEQQDKVSELAITTEQAIIPQVAALLAKVKGQLSINEQLTNQKLSTEQAGTL